MFPESAKSSQSSASEGDQKPSRRLDKEVRDMVNAIAHHIADLHKPGGIHQQHQHHHHHHEVDEDDQQGIRIVTLAGSNTGATMRSQLGDKSASKNKNRFSWSSLGGDDHIEDDGEPDDSEGTYVNSNFQAVNNSIMMSSSYNTNDPGVHLDITDVFDQQHPHLHPQHGHRMMDKRKQMGKRDKDKDVLRSEQHSAGHSD